jgi:hypothetical protein
MNRQEEQWYSDVPKYLPISLSVCLSIYINIHLLIFYMYVCCSLYVKTIRCFCPGHIMQTKRPLQKLLEVVTLHHIKCAEIYGGSSYSMKRQEEQWYCDVPKYLSISLSIYIYIYIHLFIFCLVCRSICKIFRVFVQDTSCRQTRAPQILLVVVALHHIKCAVIL